MIIIQSFLEIIVFLFVILVCFYLPGKFLFARLKLSLNSPDDLFLPFVLGIMIFTLISYIFSWLKLEFVILPLFLIISFFVLKSKKWLPEKISELHRWPIFVVIVLAIVFSLSMLTTGVYGDSITYRRDDLWHLALINELKNNFPPDHPGFAGVTLKGYHFFYNFILAKVSNIFFISPFSLYFHYFPLLIAILWGFGVYVLMFKWSRKVSIALLAVFLTMFGGSFAFILRLRGHEDLSLDSAFGIQQPISSLINPPFAISIIIVISTLFAIHKYLESKNITWLVPVALFVGLVTMFKVYAGIILGGGYILFCLIETFRSKNYLVFVSLFTSGVLFIITYGIFRDPTSTLIFSPFWAPHSVLVDNMPWYGYAEKMYTYTKLSVIKGIIETELYSWYVFMFGNLGTRLIGLLFLPLFFLKKRKKPSFFFIIVFTMTLISILIPLFFIQSGKVFEIIQMSWYFLFFISLFAAYGFDKFFSLFHQKKLKIAIFVVILTLTLPSAYDNYRVFFNHLDSTKSSFSSFYLKTMQFLKSEGNYNQTIIEIPERNIQTRSDLSDWYAVSTPKITAFGNKRSYLSNEYIDFTGIDARSRINFIHKIIIFNNTSIKDSSNYKRLQEEVRLQLKNEKISFVYSPYTLPTFENSEYIHKIYENSEAKIYKVVLSEAN